MYKTIFLMLLLTGCDLTDKNDQLFNCDSSLAEPRAEFIRACVTELKAKLLTCEGLSERLYCKPRKTILSKESAIEPEINNDSK